MMQKSQDWYKEWFNTPFYHILYKYRNEQEARVFIHNLAKELHFVAGQKALDLACGRGRHALHLWNEGLDVVGVDLSGQNIAYAKQYERPHLRFDVHDMRLPYATEAFDYVFNLFTSFGYFESDDENYRVIEAIYKELKPGGQAVIDFLNPAYVMAHLKQEEEKHEEGITFYIRRFIDDGFVVKRIQFRFEGQDFEFFERVRLFHLDDFRAFFQKAGLTLKNLWGDYALSAYEAPRSPRMIMHVCKELA
ncbi:class I SAM-dependent methyltransferase [Thermonema rossianum]|jgi:SAM-dependent methyltransferase|uniref:class I SAM-dependent methyltransferase n=1 Tax=Thermonema rossianum TaxID=55505 RepID=UPI00056F1721|nr:class I SAM-dependent methyltransferase [Thermonema rossianum]